MLITLEGIDGVGKSSLATRLTRSLEDAGATVYSIHQPGNSSIGEFTRKTIFNPDFNRSAASILIQADRIADIHENIIPALKAGNIVIIDRYIDSTTAYQSYGEGWPLHVVEELNYAVCPDEAWPDVTFLLDAPASISSLRAARGSDFYPPDKIDQLEDIRQGYLKIAKYEPNRIIVVDATNPAEDVYQAVRYHLRNNFGI